jgi:predicted transcriptional regulator
MQTQQFHPKAFLTRRRNVKAGLRARSLILSCLEGGPKNTREICREPGLSYPKVAYHLKSLATERLVTSGGKRPYIWTITKYGQQALES